MITLLIVSLVVYLVGLAKRKGREKQASENTNTVGQVAAQGTRASKPKPVQITAEDKKSTEKAAERPVKYRVLYSTSANVRTRNTGFTPAR